MSGKRKSTPRGIIAAKIILWSVTAFLLAAGIAGDGRGCVSVSCLAASVLLGIITAALTFRWDGRRGRENGGDDK